MKWRRQNLLCSGVVSVFVALTSACLAMADESNEPLDFVRDVQPILRRHCFACHGSKKQEGGLRLDARLEALWGGDSGAAIVPHDVNASLVIQRINSADESERMPLDQPALQPHDIKLIRRWIESGASWPQSNRPARQVASDHWSFQPIRSPELPLVRDVLWARNPIDLFIGARLDDAGVRASPEAERATLLRRLYLDLTGLPPRPAEVQAFLRDQRPDAFERQVDAMLASPHLGERMGQWWLDAARYADSDGYEMDYPRPNAWRWRDWVISAINSDMPFDQFTIEQLAGDLIANATLDQQLATGFHRNTLTNTENGIDKEEYRVKAIVDRVNTTGAVWLGLTIGCAECHSHKYDPIRQREYYSLFAFFNDRVDESEVTLGEPNQKASVFRARARPRRTRVHVRGNFLEPGRFVAADAPSVLPPMNPVRGAERDRLDLASWIVDSKNPLTARVAVNRVWQHLFGVGLVSTPGDFGAQGERPSHPLLLDWLALELQRRNWSRKEIIRLIVTSATWRQSAAARPELSEIDPLNRLLGRQNRFRLDAESIRDQYLAAAGLLDRRIGGPSFFPPLPSGMSQIGFKLKWKESPLVEQYRRGMYIVTQRNLAFPMLKTFDRPDSNVSCVARELSNSPLQSLTQMNNPLMLDCARALAQRVLRPGAAGATRSRIDHAFQACLSRQPTFDETAALLLLHKKLSSIYRDDAEAVKELVDKPQSIADPIELAVWVVLARTIMNLDEFVTRE